MGTCYVPNCGAYTLAGDMCALCANTIDAKSFQYVAADAAAGAARARSSGASRPSWILMSSTSTPNADFAAQCEPYERRFAAILARGKSGKPESVLDCMLYHDTQPSANKTVFFDWQGNVMRIFAVGGHKGGSGRGNSSYSFVWYDGKSKSWTRPSS